MRDLSLVSVPHTTRTHTLECSAQRAGVGKPALCSCVWHCALKIIALLRCRLARVSNPKTVAAGGVGPCEPCYQLYQWTPPCPICTPVAATVSLCQLLQRQRCVAHVARCCCPARTACTAAVARMWRAAPFRAVAPHAPLCQACAYVLCVCTDVCCGLPVAPPAILSTERHACSS